MTEPTDRAVLLQKVTGLLISIPGPTRTLAPFRIYPALPRDARDGSVRAILAIALIPAHDLPATELGREPWQPGERVDQGST